MDLDIAKQYKEYEEITSKLTPLRNEYNFIVTDIVPRQDEYNKIVKLIQENRTVIEKDKQDRERQKQKEIEQLNASKMAFDSEKNREIKEIIIKTSKAQDEFALLTKNNEELQNDIVKNTKENNDLIKSISENNIRLPKLENEYNNKLKEYNSMKEYVSTKDMELSNREKDIIKKEKEIEKNTIKYNKIKYDAENSVGDMQKMMLESIKKEETLLKLQADIDRKLIVLKEKEQTNTKILEDAKSDINTITQKELEINKKISEFQDEKFKFLVLMKQKGIKKSDIDQLEKDFTL